MEPDTAGDPMGRSLLWTRKSSYKVREALKQYSIHLCANSAGKIIKHLGYSLKLNRKSISETNHPDRDLQFQQINYFVKFFEDMGQAIASTDTKKGSKKH